jgi:glycosyltransferase involved in cell wall biosynthesis
VPGKGADVLIDALAILAAKGIRVRATIIGDGPEEAALKARVASAGLGGTVLFLGSLDQAALVRELNRHRILAVPSYWGEPFGIVALEGAACGCVPVGTDDGGLPEAIGSCGPVVAKRDPAALACALETLLADSVKLAGYRQAAAAHLAKHRAGAMIGAYEDIIRKMIGAS